MIETPDVLLQLAIGVVYVAIGVTLAAYVHHRLTAMGLNDTQRGNLRILLPAIAVSWPGALVLGLACQYEQGRRVVGRLCGVDPDEITPDGS